MENKLSRKEKKKLYFHKLHFIAPEGFSHLDKELSEKDRKKINLIYKLKKKDQFLSIAVFLLIGIAFLVAFFYEKGKLDQFIVLLTIGLEFSVIFSLLRNREYKRELYDNDLKQSIKVVIEFTIEAKVSGPKIGNVFRYKDSGVVVPVEFYNKYEIGEAIVAEFAPNTLVLLDMYKV